MSAESNGVWGGRMPAVGQVAERSRTVTAQDIGLFTEISGDRNPLHYDDAAARASRFGEIVVQGGVTSAILNAVVAEDLPGPGTVFLEVHWRFKAPVRPGDSITGRVEVKEVREDKPITKLDTRVTRDDGTVVLEGDAVCYTMTTRLNIRHGQDGPCRTLQPSRAGATTRSWWGRGVRERPRRCCSPGKAAPCCSWIAIVTAPTRCRLSR